MLARISSAVLAHTKGRRRCVRHVEVLTNGVLKGTGAAMRATLDRLVESNAPALHEVEPRRAGRGEVEVKPRMRRTPSTYARRLVCPVVVQDEMNVEVYWNVRAASPVSPSKLAKAVEVFGPCLCQYYGQAESGLLTWLDNETLNAAAAGHHPERLRSCGRPVDAVRVGIMDEAGHLLERNRHGEIVVRGRGLASEYYKSPGAMQKLRGYGWHHTGDIGYVDDYGFVYIVDRKNDVIIVGGSNVYPAEVEKVLMELPDVRECAVIGVRDDLWGEVVKAIVVLTKDNSYTPEEIMRHCRGRVGGSKLPRSIEFWREIPHTPTGKADKRLIRRRLRGAEVDNPAVSAPEERPS